MKNTSCYGFFKNPLPLEILIQLAWGTATASGVLKVPGDSKAENLSYLLKETRRALLYFFPVALEEKARSLWPSLLCAWPCAEAF